MPKKWYTQKSSLRTIPPKVSCEKGLEKQVNCNGNYFEDDSRYSKNKKIMLFIRNFLLYLIKLLKFQNL